MTEATPAKRTGDRESSLSQELETDPAVNADLELVGRVVAEHFEDWSAELLAEFEANAFNDQVGSRLLLETSRIRVWEIRLDPGERLPAHRHVLDYFWTALTDGESVQHTHDGTTREVSYKRGDTRAFEFGPGQYLLHDLNNSGSDELAFVTVEFRANRIQRRAEAVDGATAANE